MKLPRGQHRDDELEDVPTAYLTWVLEEWSLSRDLVLEIERQLAMRRGEGVVRREAP